MKLRSKVAAKIWVGCTLIVLLGATTIVAAYRGLVRVRAEIRHLADVTEPIKSATHEMEINIKGIAVGTLSYLSAPSAASWELVNDNEADFERFHAEYSRLAATGQEIEFGQDIRVLYEHLKCAAGVLKEARDSQVRSFGEVLKDLQMLDTRLEKELMSGLDPIDPNDQAKVDAIASARRSVARLGMFAAAHRWSGKEEGSEMTSSSLDDCETRLKRLGRLEWTGEKSDIVMTLAELFQGTRRKVEGVIDEMDAFERGSIWFMSLRDITDKLLDDRIQPLAVDLVRRPRDQAEAAASSAVVQLVLLVVVFVFAAALVSLLLLRTVSRPLRSLTRGTEVVSGGDLGYRVPLVSSDEFALLTVEFNRMVARLQETLVSKEQLERSEQELKLTVRALQTEISERKRAEEEQERLHASLRRAETLSALGTLVAGVAHQVRNPLFGTSSVLDAMEARLGTREEYRPYLEALRDSISRLTVLMNELMEYGRLPGSNRAPGSIADVFSDAASACRELARKAQVEIEGSVPADTSSVLMDRPRLSRVLENLIENAIQHSVPGGTVSVSAREARIEGATWVEVEVEDSGPGFREADLPRIFDPFFTRRPGGTGLGLALVERIVAGHGGSVTASNRPGGGACIRVRIPAVLCASGQPSGAST